jgi:hypothetical protein
METLRNGSRVIASALMNSELVYSFLIGMGWFFLMGWAIALVVACASAFRQDRGVQLAGVAPNGRSGRLAQSGRRVARGSS